MRNLRIKRQYSIIAHSPDLVELRYGVWNPISFTLSDQTNAGKLFRLLDRLDGSLSLSQIAKEENVSHEEIHALVDHLVQLGVIESDVSSSLDHYLDNFAPGSRGAAKEAPDGLPVVLLGDSELTSQIKHFLQLALPERDISLISPKDPIQVVLSDADTTWLANGLRFAERTKIFEKLDNKFLIFATKIIHPIQFQLVNRISLDRGFSWIHAAIDGPFLFVGPMFVPHRSACYECFERRVTMNLREAASYQRYKRALVEREIRCGRPPVEPVLVGLLASHTAFEALNFLLTRASSLVNKVLAIYLPTMEITYNEVLRVPGCEACSPIVERDGKELYFDIMALIQK
jgi:bacteriocin biosynthesis cyclodehydratase domain-containing protein